MKSLRKLGQLLHWLFGSDRLTEQEIDDYCERCNQLRQTLFTEISVMRRIQAVRKEQTCL